MKRDKINKMISPFKSLFVCLVIAFAVALLFEKVFMMNLDTRIVFIPHLGIILFLSFWILAESTPSSSYPNANSSSFASSRTARFRYNRLMYTIMMAVGLLLAKPLLISSVPETANSPGSDEKRFAPNQKGGFAWHIRLENAKKTALKNQNPILIYFSADWCLPCLEMEANFFPSKQFKKFVKGHNVVLLLYDMNQSNPEGEKVASEYSVEGLPTMIVTDHKGKIIDKVLGFRSIDKTIRELKEVIEIFQK